MTEINTERLVLQPVGRDVARALLDGQPPHGMVMAAGYPSKFSCEVSELAAAADPAVAATGPYFIVRKADRRVVGEIGSDIDTCTDLLHAAVSSEELDAVLERRIGNRDCNRDSPKQAKIDETLFDLHRGSRAAAPTEPVMWRST